MESIWLGHGWACKENAEVESLYEASTAPLCIYNLSWTRCVSETWDTFSVCNLFHCRLWRCLNMCGFCWGKRTDFILLVPIWCTIGWKSHGYTCLILCSTWPCSSSTCICCHQNNCKHKTLNLGWSGWLICMVQTEILGKKSGKGISTWQVESRSSVIFASVFNYSLVLGCVEGLVAVEISEEMNDFAIWKGHLPASCLPGK